MFRRIEAALIASVLVLGGAGCGGEEKPSFSTPSLGGTGGGGGSAGLPMGGSNGTSGGSGGTQMAGAAGMPAEMGGTAGMGGMAGAPGMGGMAGAPPVECPAVTFVNPLSNATLGVEQDGDNNCSNGVQVGVTVAVAAANGTSLALGADGIQVATTQVQNAVATFPAFDLGAAGTVMLTASLEGEPQCATTIQVEVACTGISCSIVKPVISATHPALNGIPAGQGGDRVSGDGSPYQVAVQVQTNASDGKGVLLAVDGSPNLLAAIVSGGLASFPGVTLTPDGAHTLQATCEGPDGLSADSASLQVTVDTLAPDLAPSNVQDGEFFGPGEPLTICGVTAASDALGLPDSLGARKDNFCVSLGSSTPLCAPATTNGVGGSQDGACVTLACPGGAPFDLTLTLSDLAGNVREQTVQSVSCASTLPSVQIVEPVQGVGADLSTHILAANASQTRKDQNANQPGAQYTVKACTDAAGSTGTLRAGQAGGALSVLGTAQAVQAQQSDGCPAQLGYVLTFANVTLPESVADTSGQLVTGTELEVEVVDISRATNQSPKVQVWVDSAAPVFSPFVPANLCSYFVQSDVDVNEPLTFTASNAPVNLTVVRPSGSQDVQLSTVPSAGRVQGTVLFEVGTNQLSGFVQEPSGNVTQLAQPCVVTVSNPPRVTWQNLPGAFSAANDGDTGTSGWQGSLAAKVEVPSGMSFVDATSGDVTFTANGSPLGTASIVNGLATLNGITIPDGASVTLRAATSDISPFGVGQVTAVRVVDTATPAGVTDLAATVADRRQTSFQLVWKGASDGGSAVKGYTVRWWKGGTCDASGFAGGSSVPFVGTPAAPGADEGILVSSLFIENNYCFGVQAADAADNLGPVTVTGPARAAFNVTSLDLAVGNDGSRMLDGSSDFDGDGFSDLLVGVTNGNAAYLYWGSSTGYSSTPGVTFTGDVNTRFGIMVAAIGDIDGDTREDIAVSATLAGGTGTVYIFKGRSNWRSFTALTGNQADYQVSFDSTADPKAANAQLGVSLARLKDFDGDGLDDVAIGASFYDSFRGAVTIVRGSASFPAQLKLAPAADSTAAYTIVGEATNDFFGQRLLGLGSYYPGTGTTLVVAAPNVKSLYTFTKPASSLVSGSTARHKFTGSPAGTGQSLASLGSVLGSPALGAATTSAGNLPRGFFGLPADGPFGTIADYTSTVVGEVLANSIIGSGFSGLNLHASFIGSAGPDAVMATQRRLYFLSTSQLAASQVVNTAAPVVFDLPSDWRGVSFASSPIRDLNGDGYGDIAVGEFQGNPAYQGRVRVLW